MSVQSRLTKHTPNLSEEGLGVCYSFKDFTSKTPAFLLKKLPGFRHGASALNYL